MKNNFVLELCIYFNKESLDRCTDFYKDLINLDDFIIQKFTLIDFIIFLIILFVLYKIVSRFVIF